ncbi:MAG: NHLP bacteriocin system secretion protein [Proteobacteria bacterium]|nr:NHLP bacteriocin system secretion protein [Pseudomonadota bacterium]
MLDQTLFRPEALESLRNPEQVGRALQLVRAPYRLVVVAVAVVLAAGLAASALIKVPISVNANGVILPQSATLESTVAAQHDGQIARLKVKAGDMVAAGDVIAEMSQPSLEHDLALARDEEAGATQRLHDIQQLQKQSTATLEPLHALQAKEAEESIRRLTVREADLTKLTSDSTALRANGVVSLDRLLQLRGQLSETQDAIAAKKAALLSLRVEWAEKANQYARETKELEEKADQADRQVRRLEAQLGEASVVRATQAGRVTEIKLVPGDLVRFNSAVIGLLPEATDGTKANTLIAIALVPLNEGKKVAPGMQSYIDPASVRRDVYGEIPGKVVDISSTPATPEFLRNILRNDELVRKVTEGGPTFLATIELERDPSTPSGYAWSASKGPEMQLTAGTALRAEIQTEQVSLLGLLMPALRQLLRGEPVH